MMREEADGRWMESGLAIAPPAFAQGITESGGSVAKARTESSVRTSIHVKNGGYNGYQERPRDFA